MNEPSDTRPRKAGSRRDARRLAAVAAAAALSLMIVGSCFFAVDRAEYAVVTEFGDPVQVITQPGLGTKLPYQSVRKFDRRLFVYAPPLSEFLTLEKTAVVASGAILWRIADPKRFFETVFDRLGAESRLSDILFAELGAAIGNNPLAAFVSAAPEEYRAEAILEDVAATFKDTALRDYGIEVVDVQLQRFDFPERNRLRVYARMASERGRLSMKYRAEGEEAGLKIRAAADHDKARIVSEAFAIAEQHRGEGEAEAARLYAEAVSTLPEFYKFLRTMEASRKIVEPDTALLLPADSPLFGLLKDSGYYNRDHPAGAAGPDDAESEANEPGQ